MQINRWVSRASLLLQWFLLPLTVLFLQGQVARAQDPSYEIIGAEELAGITIYDQYMSSEELLYIATNDGVYTYNSVEFKKLITPVNARGRSYFDLRESPQHDIFCINVNGQLFKVVGDSLKVFFEFSEELAGIGNNYVLLDDGILFVSEKTFLIDYDGQLVKALDKYYSNFLDEPYVYSGLVDEVSEVSVYRSSNLEELPELRSKIPGASYFRVPLILDHERMLLISYLRDSIWSYNLRTKAFRSSGFQYNISSWLKIDSTTHWVMRKPNGVIELGNDWLDTASYRTYYPDQYVAPQDANAHGIFLGTNGYGVYHVKSPHATNLTAVSEAYDLLDLKVGPHNKMVALTNKQELLLIDEFGNYEEIYKTDQPITYFGFAPESRKIILFPDVHCVQYDLQNKQLTQMRYKPVGSLKNLVELSPNRFLFSSSASVGEMRFDGDSILSHNRKTVRAHTCIRFQGQDLFAFNTGLVVADSSTSKLTALKYEGEHVFVREMIQYQDTLVINSTNRGLLLYVQGRLIPLVLPSEVTASNAFKDIQISGDQLYVSSTSGIICYNFKSKKSQIISISDGLNSPSIRSFCVLKDFLFVLTELGLQKIDHKKDQQPTAFPKLAFKSIQMNDEAISSTRSSFEYWENRFAFEVLGNAFGKQHDTKIKYKLEGLTDAWSIRPYADNSIEYLALPPGAYTLRVFPVFKGQAGKEIRFAFTIESPVWETIWFYLLLVVATGLGALLIYRRYSLRTIQKIALESEMNRLKLTAIQSQMNPHFIFNAINSIQESVLSKDKKNTYRHINKFSKLVRLTLNHSSRESVTIEEELTLLQAYLDLEQIRFAGDFEYSIDNNLDEELSIPPMLVQPFVENAILHGLFHKEGKKHLSIALKREDHVVITITDNGIGRVASKAINQRQRKSYNKSFATSSVKDRIEILKQNQQQAKLGFTYIDLTDEQGQSCGTTVILVLPILEAL